MTRALFVTGTDTGVGKTTVAAGILAALARRGVRVAALKPAETGCARGSDGSLVPADGLLLKKAARLDEVPLDAIVPFRYSVPVAPAVAARIERTPFVLKDALVARAALVQRAPRLLLVEGAGGLLVPFSDELLAADVALALAPTVLVVARASLGTINHTLLTVEAARRRGLDVAGVVLNRVVAERGPDEEHNAAEISRLSGVRVLGTVAHLAAHELAEPHALADAVEAAFDPALLLEDPFPSAQPSPR